MRSFFPQLFVIMALPAFAAEKAPDSRSIIEQHTRGSGKLADEQDELSADVQQLVIEQTVAEVIELLTEVEDIMGETTDYLVERETGGRTIAAQTEIIEKIHNAAKAKQQQEGSGEAGSAMMDMMERMMGKTEGEGKDGGKKGDQPGDKAGEGQTGESDTANTAEAGISGGTVEERRIPKAAGTAGRSLPGEFQQALDAYNRGVEAQSR